LERFKMYDGQDVGELLERHLGEQVAGEGEEGAGGDAMDTET
jgi:hypothetical protein